VVEADTGEAGLRIAARQPPDLVILDLGLPDIDGQDVLQRLREWLNAPILVLSARDQEPQKIEALDHGADDYLTKPFGVRELVARVRALLRRRRPVIGEHAPAVQAGALLVEPARRQARLDDREIELTAHEFDLLYVLASNRGIVFSRDALVQRVWGEETHITVRSVDTLVKRLRRKIENDPADPKFILTVWGSGYKFADA
jgi:DNA-binding response OmpR family regulator